LLDLLRKQTVFSTDLLMSREYVTVLMNKTEYFSHNISNSDMSIIIDYLISIDECRANSDSIKFKSKTSKLTIVNETDTGIITIKQTIKTLQTHITELDSNISKIDIEIKSLLVGNSNKHRALLKLKHKKKLIVIRDNHSQSFQSLVEIIDSINQAQTQVDVMYF
jgi:septal ring factor EnvC (AmiA/AmiB activator)